MNISLLISDEYYCRITARQTMEHGSTARQWVLEGEEGRRGEKARKRYSKQELHFLSNCTLMRSVKVERPENIDSPTSKRACPPGWSDFWEEKNWAFAKLCEIVLGPKFKNLTFKFCFLTWRMASANVERYPKMGKTNFLSCTRGECLLWVYLLYLKLKMKRNTTKHCGGYKKYF